MSRSYKKTPISGMTCADSEKQDKRRASRKTRRILRQQLRDDIDRLADIVLIEATEAETNWNFAKDGKHWYGHCKEEDIRKWSRK